MNWKTTFFGIVAGSIPILQTALDSNAINWSKIALGLAIMALGVVAADAKKNT